MTMLKCPCGSEAYRLIYKGVSTRTLAVNYSYELHKCDSCELVRVCPIPNISLYTNGYINSTQSGEYLIRDKPWCKILAEEIVGFLSKHELQASTVLDVGCNGGELVKQLNERGVKSEGCDVDPIAVAFGRSNELNLFVQDLAQEPLKKKYGVIVLNHTLEHVEELEIVLRRVHDALYPGGLLYIRVPNYDGWIPKLMKENWGFLVPDQHVWQFTPQTLKRHVENAGSFRILELSSKSNLEYKGTGIKGLVKNSLIAISVFLNQGDELTSVFVRSQ